MSTPTPARPESKPSLRPLILVLLGLVGVVVVLRLVAWYEPQPPEGRRIGNLCPEVAGVDVDGKPVKLSDYKGKVVLISFWATWCPPCQKQIPHEVEMVNTVYEDRPFTVLGVALDSADTLRDYFQRRTLPWPNIVGEDRAVSRAWGVNGIPAAVLVDHTGVIQNTWMQGTDPEAVWTAVERLVAAAEKK
jgi:peroxiredoxin